MVNWRARIELPRNQAGISIINLGEHSYIVRDKD